MTTHFRFSKNLLNMLNVGPQAADKQTNANTPLSLHSMARVQVFLRPRSDGRQGNGIVAQIFKLMCVVHLTRMMDRFKACMVVEHFDN